MEITQEEKSKISPFMSDLWVLIKQYYAPDQDPDGPYWHDLIEAASALGEKHNDPLAHKLILAFLDYIEEKENEQSKKERVGTGGTQGNVPGANGA